MFTISNQVQFTIDAIKPIQLKRRR